MATEVQTAEPARVTGRPCKTPGCPGRAYEYKRENCTQHIWRKFECELCRLRWGSVERDAPASIEPHGKHGTVAALRRLEIWLAQSAENPPVYPTERNLFSSLD